MKIIVAPDSYKECLSSHDVAGTIAAAVRSQLPDSTVVEMPLADGGEGTLQVLDAALGGIMHTVEVEDPLGRPTMAQYGIAGDKAIIEVAQACGLQLLKADERRPLLTSTRGVGSLLLDAHNHGARHFIVGLGGTSTCDGGAGMMEIAGIREILADSTFDILCDVTAAFVGHNGAARIFGPQKGASQDEVEQLEERMLSLVDRILSETGRDISQIPGSGAAGGLGGCFLAYFNSSLKPGIDTVLDLLDFDRQVSDADLVITGEGKSDLQTLCGKAALGVLRRSGDVPVALVSGRIEDQDELAKAGFAMFAEVSPRDLPAKDALNPEIARKNIASAVNRLDL